MVFWNTHSQNSEPLCKKSCYPEATMLQTTQGCQRKKPRDYIKKKMLYQPQLLQVPDVRGVLTDTLDPENRNVLVSPCHV